jgi:hypothetical protein
MRPRYLQIWDAPSNLLGNLRRMGRSRKQSAKLRRVGRASPAYKTDPERIFLKFGQKSSGSTFALISRCNFEIGDMRAALIGRHVQLDTDWKSTGDERYPGRG